MLLSALVELEEDGTLMAGLRAEMMAETMATEMMLSETVTE
jgi:hypothetical protein